MEQLRPGGAMLIPVGPPGRDQKLCIIEKKMDGTETRKDLMGVIYGSLGDREQQVKQ